MKKEKAIWLFAGGDMQEISARKVIELGYKLIITDMNPACICAKYAHELIEINTFDIKGNLHAAEKLQKLYGIKAVFTVAADCHETVAHVGKILKLHAINPEISHVCRYKHIGREILFRAGIPQPRFKVVKTLDQARAFIMEIGGEAVIKSTNNSGSRGFNAIKNIDELNTEIFERALSAGTTGQVIIEEMLQPIEDNIAEQSVETVWYNGKMYWLNWVDRLFRLDFHLFKDVKTDIYLAASWGVELGHINPAIHDYSIKKEVFELIYRAGIAIGMGKEKRGHILKADIMLTKSGPYILELTPRLSGGWDSSGTTPARGADFVGGAIKLALGKILDIDLWHNHFEYKNQNLFASVFAKVDSGAKDCIGRKFSIGCDFHREKSIKKALKNLLEGNYAIQVEQ